MTTWNQILNLPENYRQQVFAIYNSSSFLALCIRRNLAAWIEAQDWSFYATSTFDENIKQQCSYLLQQFIEQLEMLLVSTDDRNVTFPIEVCLNCLQRSLENADFEKIIRHVDYCLRTELNLIKQYQNSLVSGSTMNSQKGDLEAACCDINKKIFYTASLLVKLDQLKSRSLLSQLNALYANDGLSRHLEVLGQIELTSGMLINELTTWKAAQQSPQKTPNSAHFEFYEYTEQCQSLASSLLLLWKQLKKVEYLVEGQLLVQCRTMKERVASTLKSLVNATFTIDQQPYRVIKTNLKLKRIIVSSLLGNLFASQTALPTVRAKLINEHQARQLFASNADDLAPGTPPSGEITHSCAVMQPKGGDTLSATFAQMQVKKVQRMVEKKRKSTDSVMDEKLAFLFVTVFALDEELQIGVKVLSEPVVIIVNAYQESHAQATILWDIAFAEPNRNPFDVLQNVPFSQLARILSQKFLEHAGRSLSDNNVHYLSEKLLGKWPIDTPQPRLVSFSQFAREHIRCQPFTFWDWFSAALKLTNDHLRDLWYAGTIVGFISRRRAEELLFGQPVGTFLLRFSDSRLGGISIALVASINSVTMIEPFSAGDLKSRSLADRLRDFEQLQFLYPGVPKEEAFGRFYSQGKGAMSVIKDGYSVPVQLNFVSSALR